MNISFHKTTPQIEYRTKTKTRRLGWDKVKVGQILNAIDKGLKKGEKVRYLCQIRVTEHRYEPLNLITQQDVIAEGFPKWTPEQFITFFCEFNKCSPDTLVTVIGFEYVAPVDVDGGIIKKDDILRYEEYQAGHWITPIDELFWATGHFTVEGLNTYYERKDLWEKCLFTPQFHRWKIL